MDIISLGKKVSSSCQGSRGIFASDGNEESLKFGGSGLVYRHVSGGALRISLQTNNVFRDTSNWYHVVCAVDHSNSTTNDKVILYVNGVRQTSFFVNTIASATYNSTLLTAGNTIQIGMDRSGQHLDGYMAEMHFVDGQQLTPTTFGETKQGVWIPKTISNLTYGNNGFYLNFGNSSAIGEDSAGSNDYTAYNLNDYDIVPDTPTNNWSTLNPLIPSHKSSNGSLSEGNLKFTASSSWGGSKSSIAIPSTGKWYAEMRVGSTTSNSAQVQFVVARMSTANGYDTTERYGFEFNNGFFVVTGSSYSTNGGFTTSAGKIIQLAIDSDAGKIWFGYGNTYYRLYNATDGNPSAGTNESVSGLNFSTTDYAISFQAQGSQSGVLNFGQDGSFAGALTGGDIGTTADANGKGAFKYAPPSGFLALCSSNLPDVTLSANEDEQPNDYFQNKHLHRIRCKF